MWAASSEMCGEHVGKSVKVVDGVGWEGGEPLEGGAFECCGESFAEDCVLGRVQGDVCDVNF